MVAAMRVDLGLPGADHEVVVGRVVGDVAGAVGLLDAADAVLQARRCPGPPTAGPASPGRAGTAGTPVPVRPSIVALGSVANCDPQVGQVVDRREPPRLGAVGQVAVGEQDHRRAVGQRDPGRLERGVEAVRRATAARRSAPAPRRCGRTSPAAGRPARSWSACRSTGRRAARRRRPAAAPATTAEPDRLGLERQPGPGGRWSRRASRRTPRRAPRRRRRSRPRPGRCARRTACACSARAGCPRPG